MKHNSSLGIPLQIHLDKTEGEQEYPYMNRYWLNSGKSETRNIEDTWFEQTLFTH